MPCVKLAERAKGRGGGGVSCLPVLVVRQYAKYRRQDDAQLALLLESIDTFLSHCASFVQGFEGPHSFFRVLVTCCKSSTVAQAKVIKRTGTLKV